MTIQELREKRARLWEETKAFLDSHRGEDGLLSAEDDATYGKMEADITALGKEVARLERQEALDKELSKAVNEPITEKPMGAKGAEKTGTASDEYRTSFWARMRSKSPLPGVLNALQIFADNAPHMDVCSVRISLFSKGNYLYIKDLLVDALLTAGFTVTLRRYIGRDDDSGYHHYVIDVDKEYIIKE